MVRRGWVWVKTCFSVRIYCDTSKAIGRAIYKNGVYELPTSEMMWRLLNDSTKASFVDVGANIGYYSLLARKRLGTEGVVMSFEPMIDMFEKLIMNIKEENIQAYQYAVSSSNGYAALNILKGAETNDGLFTLQECNEAIGCVMVPTISLDEFLYKDIHLLKIDIEGHEYSALSGAKSLLAMGKVKNIIFEDHNIDQSKVSTLLSNMGYKIFSIGWDLNGLILKQLGDSNSSLVLDAPNYIATLDAANLKAVTRLPGWTVLKGI